MHIFPILSTLSLATARYTLHLPPTLQTGPTTADYITPSLTQSDLDSPKLNHANASSFDWWHFDAIASNSPNTSVAVTFSNAGPIGYPLIFPRGNASSSHPPTNGTHPNPNQNPNPTGALWAHVWITFPSGRKFTTAVPVATARVSGSGDSSLAIWHGAGGWMGSEEGYEVEIEIDQAHGSIVEEDGIAVLGRISLERITDSHSGCSTAGNFSSALGLGPGSLDGNGGRGIGWVSVLPDAIARVDLRVNGEVLRFEGYGFHDKLWSTSPFTSSTKSLTRGRAHLGPYSLLWLSYTPLIPSDSDSGMGTGTEAGQEIVSAFLARDGETTHAGCEAGTVRMTPGREQTEGGPVSGFQVEIPGARFSVATDVEVSESRGRHVRWNGRARGVFGREGGEVEDEGFAVFERFEY
ncbi:hypothetical protein BDW59DRAFT_160024 [Aspergillus cavernicola]|uniref:AttH domain-containing protein n=1 Tax=Aspergillus cavernicola TaxID=176166 RepID=A0ABR4IIX0_9EURO